MLCFDELIAYLDTMPLGKARAVHMLEGPRLQLHEQDKVPSPGLVHGEAMIRVARRIQVQPQLQWDFKQEAAALAVSYPPNSLSLKSTHRLQQSEFLPLFS